MPSAFAFDLGGVLVDVDKSGLYRLHSDRHVVEAAFFGEAHDAMSVGTLSAGAFLDHARAVLGAAANANVDVDVDDSVAAAWCGVVRFSAGGLALLAEVAAATRVLVWSNTDPLHFGVLAPGLAPHVAPRDLVASFGVGATAPAFFERALAACGLRAADVVFVDDRADNVAAARAFGIDAHVAVGVDAARAVFVAQV